MTSTQKISKARTHLLLKQPWFGALALRLRIEETANLPTMGTDGTRLYFNPKWIETLSDSELMGVLAHEVMHCALKHPWRMKDRDHKLANIAGDMAINPILQDSGFDLPADGMFPEQYNFPRGLSMEAYYALIKQKQSEQKQNGKPGDSSEDGTPGPGPNDTQVDPAEDDKPGQSEQDRPLSETDWDIAVEQATQIARKAGTLPGGVDLAVKDRNASRVDWRTLLHRFAERTLPHDYTWANPNRRFASLGVHLPGLLRENMPRLAVAIDTSGSTTDPAIIGQFAGELTAILHDTRPESIEVVYCDTQIQKIETFTPDDPEVVISWPGGGGTAFQPVIDHFNADPPVGLSWFTDLYGSQPTTPDYPVIFVVPEQYPDQVGWFGETAYIGADR